MYNEEKNNRYDINPEENIPREVYGIPNPNRVIKNANDYDRYPSITMESARINISNSKSNYMLRINRFIPTDKYELLFDDIRQARGNLPVLISKEDYHKFMEKLSSLTSRWESIYTGNHEVKWNIGITPNDGEIRLIFGYGSFPSNWNDFIDLLIEYEQLYKKLKNNE